MQRYARAADFFHERFGPRLEFLEIGRTEWWIGRAGKNQIRHFQIADWPVVGSRSRIDFLRDAQRGFACFVRRPDVADDRRKNSVAENYQRVITDFPAVRFAEAGWQHDVRIGRADQK